MGEAELQAENEALRQQIEEHRQRELEALRQQLTEARADAAHYRAEAERNASVGRQIHLESQEELNRLRARIQALENLPNARPTFTT
jgi:hypothetical protein